MIVMGIDPGYKESAFTVWDGEKIIDKGILPNSDTLDYIETLTVYLPVHLAIEMIASYGMPVGKEIFETCVWIGRFYERWLDKKLGDAHLIFRLQVKMAFCHDSRAKDGNVRQYLINRFGNPGIKKKQGILYGVKADIWQALAVTVFMYDKLKTEGGVLK